MSQLRERTRSARPVPDEAVIEHSALGDGSAGKVLRVIGALAVLVVGAVHLEQYFAVHYESVSVIGRLFVLNFIGATVICLGLLLPLVRIRLVHAVLALGGIGIAATSFVFLFISEHQPLFGFEEHGYRPAIVIALVAEGVAVVSLAGYVVTRRRS